MAKSINYARRTFAELRGELLSFVKENYADTISDFQDASIGSLLIDLAAGMGDMISFHNDRLFQETQLGNAQKRESLLNIAITNGFKVPGKKAAVTIVDFTVVVPAEGDSYSRTYCPVLKAGAQVQGGGKVFETIEDIDFASPYSSMQTMNQVVIPVLDNNGSVLRYEITKREVVYNGITRVFRKILTTNDIRPFMEIILPESDVLEVTSVIVQPGFLDSDPDSHEFEDMDVRFHEVEALAQNKIFADNGNGAGAWTAIRKKFIREFTNKGYTKLVFGGGDGDLDGFTEALSALGDFSGLENYLSTTALGEKPRANSTMFIKYRVGGGQTSNIGPNILNSLGGYQMVVQGANPQIKNVVSRSLRANNPIPAFGGKDEPSIEELRYLISYNFAAQNRCVTLNDYLNRVHLMPGKYGAPYKAVAFKEDNKVVISILGLGADGKLKNTSLSLLQDNIAEYISGFRSINDYVEVTDGRINNIGYDFEILVQEGAQTFEVVNNATLEVVKFHDIQKGTMGGNIMLGKLIEAINNVPGVTNVINMKVYNKTGAGYSPNEVEMKILNNNTGLIDTSDYILFASHDSMFEIKNPLKDIRFTVKRLNTTESTTRTQAARIN